MQTRLQTTKAGTGKANWRSKAWRWCHRKRLLYLPPPRDEREKRRQNNPQAPGLNISLRRQSCQSQDSVKNRMSTGWSSCYEGGNLSSLKRVKITDYFINLTIELSDESCTERGHTESQTRSTGLRRPCFGGRCRKAMLGVWRRVSAAAETRRQRDRDQIVEVRSRWWSVPKQSNRASKKTKTKIQSTLCAYIHTLGPQSHRLHFNSVRKINALKPVARREDYPLEIFHRDKQ